VGEAAITCISEATGVYGIHLVDGTGKPVVPPDVQPDPVEISFQVVHVRLGSNSILVDAGLDDIGTDWGRRFAEAWHCRRTPGLIPGLQAIGESAESITHVVITHAHFDHIAGLTVLEDGTYGPRYPNARVFVGRAEWEANSERPNPESEVARRLGPIEAAGLLTLIDTDTDIAPGVAMVSAPGESPGHHVVRVTSAGETFYALGDLFHYTCEIEHLEWVAPWADAPAMVQSRRKILDDAARSGALVMFSHAKFPPWATVSLDEDGFRWTELKH
jgi:glyoxylase-like metal-dependent hydrolase (beta-lactamase superfamily II)